jgi:hypothetical protein
MGNPIVLIFQAANIAVLPFWTLMIVLPNWKFTRWVMQSLLPYALLAGVYLYLLSGALTPESIKVFSNPQLSTLAKIFSQERIAAFVWLHFLVMDLFVGRWIYWKGQRTGIWTVHSLILCLFAGPLGLLSHALTQWLAETFDTQGKPIYRDGDQ